MAAEFISFMVSSIPQNALTRFVNYPPTFANDAPVLAAFWDDIRTARTGVTVRATQSGFAPARCLVVEWNAVINSSSTTNTNPADGVFQMRLYEGSGEIEYVYGKMQIGTGSNTVTASIGFTNGFTDNSFIAIKDLTTFNVTRLQSEELATQSLVNTNVSGVISGLHSTTEGTRRKIAFTPVSCNGSFTNAYVNRVYARTMQLNWTDNITHKLGYLVYRGESSPNNYAYFTTLPATATSFIATELNTNTRYYWKIVPYTEGNTALAQELTDSTRCSMTGTYSIGPAGQFTNIKNAQDSLGLWGIVGNTNWELLPAYSFSSEVLPVRFNGLPACHEADNTITIRPATGANISFTNTTANPVFLIDSVKNIIIDGRAGGTGSSAALSLEGSGEQIKIRNGWNNTIRFVDLRSSTTNANTSPLTLEASLGGGTHHNLIEKCILHDRGGVFPLPVRLLSSKITGNFINNSNAVKSCRFYNFAGIAADINGLGWQIDSNSFYATQIINAADTSGFITLNTADNTLSHSITENYFGGSDIQLAGNTMVMNTGTVFTGVKIGSNASFMGNRFSKMKIQTVSTLTDINSKITLLQTGLAGTSPFNPINATVQNNRFGELNAADSIHFSSTTTFPVKANIIYNLNTSLTTFKQNSFVNIRTSYTNNADMSFNIIETWGNNAQIDSNTFSNTNHAYRISHKGDGSMSAIYTYGHASINGNLITNITSSRTITAIITQSNSGQITDNQISHIKSIEGSPSFYFYSAAGISAFSSSVNISRNRIVSIEDSSAASSVGPAAIFAKTCNNTIDRNFIDALVQYPHSTVAKSMVAFEVEDDHSDITNNMVRLGLDTAGNTVTNGLFVGYTNTPTSVSTIAHNSFYLAGSNAISSNNGGAFCLFWQGSSAVFNNIMVNERTYLTGNASAIYLSSASAQLPYLDYNVYYHPQGLRFSTDIDSFKVWKTDSRDPHSVFLPPNFVNRNAPTRLLDLHVFGQTVAERRGADTYTVIADFDGDIRQNKSPVDVGADAGNYTPVDLDAPSFTVIPLPDAPDTTSRFITIHITDTLSGLRTSGNTRPTIWYRKKYPTVTAWQTSFGTLESGTPNSGNWKFFINHQLLNVNVNGADSIQYYFVAQDTADYPGSNLSISPAPGGEHYSVTQQVTPPTTPYIYRINVGRYIIPPVVSVGQNQKYTSLTNDGGLFEGIRVDSVEGNITVKIISHLNENGTWGLDSFMAQRHLKLTITPGYDSVFIIKNNGNLSNDMIRLYNADNATIDGRFNGSGRWLRFVNTHSNPISARATIALYNGSDSVMIRNTELQNNTSNINNQAIVTIQQGDCREQSLVDNIFSNAPGVTGNPCTGVLGHTSSTPKRLRLALNHFVNTENNAVMMIGWADSIRVDSNHIYWTDPQPHTATDYFGINLPGSVATQEIKGNYFGGTQPFCGGSQWINNAAFNSFYFIQIGSQSQNYSRVENNTFKNVKTTNVNAYNFFPIFSYGKMIIDANIIGDTTDNASLDIACMSFTGIEATTFRHFITNNLISGISTRNTQFNSLAQGIWYTGDSTHTISNNTVRNITSASGAQFSSMPALTGIAVLSHGQNIQITENKIFNLSCTNTVPLPIAGIEVNATANAGLISRNRIYNITQPNNSNGIIAGIYLQQCGDWGVENNQITLTNGTNTNPVHRYGIYDSAFLGTTNSRTLAYNSVLIGGNQTGNSNSFGYRNAGIATTQYVKNNLLVNVRTGGTGQHGAVSIDVTTPAAIWQPQSANYNVYAVRDTNTAFRWGLSTVLDIRGWRTSSQTDGNSFSMNYLKMPPGRLFADSARAIWILILTTVSAGM
ncbi:MAG: hypothetical protein IPP93_17060 [Chitinophagaceae bacterium]|nr:hypothetical protein [Chitinophagaceae bacterium]